MCKFIESQRDNYPVKAMCEALSVSRSTFTTWQNTSQSARTDKDTEARNKVRFYFNEHRSRYGSRRLMVELAQSAHMPMSRNRIRRLMKKEGLRAIQPKSFVPKTTDSRHSRNIAPNLLAEKQITKPHEAWAGDITYLALTNGRWAYLATWIDMFTRRVVGWHIDTHLRTELIIKAFEKAVYRHQPPPGLLVHSDRGSQYASNEFVSLVKKNKFLQSMSGPDNPYDNAMAESFFGRLKTELIQQGAFINIEDARTEIFDYIECYYNTIRRHSAINYLSPDQFEKSLFTN
jgi:transposase InsO family protein